MRHRHGSSSVHGQQLLPFTLAYNACALSTMPDLASLIPPLSPPHFLLLPPPLLIPPSLYSYARKRKMEVRAGHALGFEKLRETLDWCLDLGVETVTVYAFSIENFKRSKEEVDTLMALAKVKFTQLFQKGDLIQKHGICVRILGDITLLPADLQQVIARMVNVSKHNTKAVLNVAFPYTSRHEVVDAVRVIADGVQQGKLEQEDISEDLIDRCMYTGDELIPDMMVRTSGEVRLSDFLLWQSGYTCLVFRDTLWLVRAMCTRVCLRACARPCVRACVRVRACAGVCVRASRCSQLRCSQCMQSGVCGHVF